MLAMADKNSVVEAAIPGLADRARVSIDECVDALKKLKEPDKFSRSKENEGRRIKEIDGGWFLLNHGKYRDLVTLQEKRAQDAERARRYRERKKERDDRDASREITPPSPSPSPSPSSTSGSGSLLEIPTESPKPKKRKTKHPHGYGNRVWNAYSDSFEQRYGTKPKRNAKQSSLACQLRERLGDEESVEVARYYPSTQNSYHVGRGHALAMLLADAEKVWTEWKTGRQITTTGAREADRLKKTGDGWARAIKEVCDDS
jgi:hypothetical protein